MIVAYVWNREFYFVIQCTDKKSAELKQTFSKQGGGFNSRDLDKVQMQSCNTVNI